ncbi:restriction endonuclease subunit S [bacterium]|nr:restriction endonuclease subunit S [bacterium]
MSRLNKIVPDGWTSKRFSEVFEFLSTATFSRDELSIESRGIGVHNVHYGDIHSSFSFPILDCNKEQLPEIIKQEVDQTKLQYLQDGDLIIADASEDYEGVGSSVEIENVNGKKITAGLHTFAVRDKSRITAPGYRSYLFKHPWVSNELKKIATGSKVFGISKTNLANLEIVLPTLPEQQKIARILRTWDKLIEQQTKLIAAKERFKKGLMQKLLSGELRFPGFEGEWEEVQIRKIGYEKPAVIEPGDSLYNYYSIPAWEEGKPLVVNGEKIKSSKIVVGPDTILFGKLNPRVWKVWKVEVRDNGYVNVASTEFLPITPDKSSFDVEFVFHLLNSHVIKNEVNRIIGGSTGSHQRVNPQDFYQIRVLIPTLDEQKKIARLFTKIDQELDSLNNELGFFMNQKEGLMQQLLTGKLRVRSTN